MSRLELEVSAADAGARLDALLAAQPAIGTRAAAQRLIEAGRVLVDGGARPKSHRVGAGARIVLELTGEGLPEEPAAGFEVAYEDEHLMVVDKPAGVVVHPGAGHTSGTLAQALAGRAAGGPSERAGIVHRLDRDTSGLLVLAKSQAAYDALGKLVRARAMRREYLALVEGRPGAERGTIDAPLGRDRTRRTAVSTRSDRPRRALTHFEVLETLPRTTLLRVRLETGRTHQIRAHLASIGHPVCGDRRYGGAAAGRRLVLTRQFLHSANLSFTHPFMREDVCCESKPPADLRRALDVARREPVSEGPDGG